jgi:preprotein translocase subunit SecE
MIPWREATSFIEPAQPSEKDMAKFNPGEFMRQVQAEGRKVVWPTRQETVRTAIFVAIMLVILSVFFLGLDSLFGAVVRWLLSLAS